MKFRFRFLIILSCLFFNLYGADKSQWSGLSSHLPLPESLDSSNFNYIKSFQINGWSCGYNALFNACNIEEYFGRKNQFSHIEKFFNICSAYLKEVKKKPTESSNNIMLDELSKRLQLHKFVYLRINEEKQVVPVLPTPTKINYIVGTPEQKIKQMLIEAMKKREQELIDDTQQFLMIMKDSLCFIHFVCHVYYGEDHCILASLAKQPNGKRSVYVFDNMNKPIEENSEALQYLKFINKNFITNSQPITKTTKSIKADKSPSQEELYQLAYELTLFAEKTDSKELFNKVRQSFLKILNNNNIDKSDKKDVVDFMLSEEALSTIFDSQLKNKIIELKLY